MEDIKSKLISLTDQELRDYLEASECYDGTPITPSTRMLLVRKLTRNMLNNSSRDDAIGIGASRKNYSSQNLGDSHSANELDCKPPSDSLNECQQNSKHVYYGVHIPLKIDRKHTTAAEKSHHVFIDKKEVMKFMKEFPEARFKVFQTRKEAEEFTNHLTESSMDVHEISCTSKNNNESSVMSEEKTSTFKGPKPQELVQLRKTIERGDIANFRETVWKNPRYLVGSGDTPTILQEGSRYNALHVASKAGNGAMCEAILETVSNPSFIHLLYSGADALLDRGQENRVQASLSASVPNKDQAVMDCIAYLLDLYLNTPEKGRNETPLHFASKFGKVDAVRVLVSYPLCDRTRPNKLGETPEDLICSRSNDVNEGDKKKIRQLIKDRFYVPVMRPEDLCVQASIGDPFSPEKPPISSPVSKRDPKLPTQEINAYAGPMSLEEAKNFCRRWKSPLKVVNGKWSLSAMSQTHQALSTSTSSCSSSPLRLCDPERGLEREGRALANEFQVGWMEYWPFLGAFTNLTCKNGMQILENYFRHKFLDACKLKKQSEEETLHKGEMLDVVDEQESVYGLPDDINLVSQEVSPVTGLCQAMESCTLSPCKNHDEYINKPTQNLGFTKLVGPFSLTIPSPLQYVEKSCRIFALRISDSVIREAFRDSRRVASNAVCPEVHHLRRLVSSFKEDSRFLSIDFSRLHSRVARLAADGLWESMSSSCITMVMVALVCTPPNLCSSSDEEEERFFEKESDCQVGGREWRLSMGHGLQKVEAIGLEEEVEHVRCLMTLIKEALDKIGLSKTPLCTSQEEGDQIEATWAKMKPCPCTWSNLNSSHHHAKSSSRVSLAAVSRRLSFENLSIDETQFEKNSTEQCRSWRSQSSSNHSAKVSDYGEKLVQPVSSSGDFAINTNEESGDSDDVFYTPPSSPTANNTSMSSSDDENEVMVDTEEITKIFIEGDHPTKLDLDVLYALEGAGKINPQEFPYIYQWKNLVLMHTAEERESWLSPHAPRYRRWTRFTADCPVEKTLSRHAATSPSSFVSIGHHQYNCSPLVETPMSPALG